jgi:hypothetical protein
MRSVRGGCLLLIFKNACRHVWTTHLLHGIVGRDIEGIWAKASSILAEFDSSELRDPTNYHDVLQRVVYCKSFW